MHVPLSSIDIRAGICAGATHADTLELLPKTHAIPVVNARDDGSSQVLTTAVSKLNYYIIENLLLYEKNRRVLG